MSNNIDIYEEVKLPLIPLRGLVGFPGVQLNIEIIRTPSLKAFTAAATVHDAKVLLVTQKDIAVSLNRCPRMQGSFSDKWTNQMLIL